MRCSSCVVKTMAGPYGSSDGSGSVSGGKYLRTMFIDISDRTLASRRTDAVKAQNACSS